ncbi:MAG: DegT/DnrJ/EryC1/StrS family aminotransferase [Pirellulales bacterium]|nr:DegT/DnrJ/EryC1/StrS family aminotransferase [Pirellulales bacterium]
MWVRKRFDIAWSDLASALRDCLIRWDRATLAENVEDLWSPPGDAFACLSVRTGFDLWLKSLNLPQGSEVLVSAITIRDMIRIIEEHGLTPVPVDLHPDDLSVNLDSLEQAITPRSRVILVAHLFGTRQGLDAVIEIARRHDLLVAEDCAQAFVGRQFTGHPQADLSMFSFGPIKTATALAGALLNVRNPAVRERMRRIQATYPVQSHGSFAKRVFKFGLMKFMSYWFSFGALVAGMKFVGRDPDHFVASVVRGFPGPTFFNLIRRQPSAALLALLFRRIAYFHKRSIQRRTEHGNRLRSLLPSGARYPGAESDIHSYWVFPVLAEEPSRMIRRLLMAGFDASAAHSLSVVQPPADRPELRAERAEWVVPRIVHLPCYPEMPDHELRRLADEVRVAMRKQPALRNASDCSLIG